MKFVNFVRYFAFGVGVLLLTAYSSVGAFAAGDECRSGTCNFGQSYCNAISWNGGSCDNPDNCFCACTVDGQNIATTDCIE